MNKFGKKRIISAACALSLFALSGGTYADSASDAPDQATSAASSEANTSRYFGTSGVTVNENILPTTVSQAAMDESLESLSATVGSLMDAIATNTQKVNDGRSVRTAASGTDLAGFRADIGSSGSALFSEDMYQAATSSIDGSILLTTTENTIQPLKGKKILLIAGWTEAGDDASGSEKTGPDGPNFGLGFQCLTDIAPSEGDLYDADGVLLPAADLRGLNSNPVETLLGVRCDYELTATIDAIYALHDDDGLAVSKGFCAVMGSDQANCADVTQ